MGKGRQRADADRLVFVKADAAQGVDAVDAHQLRARAPALANLHQHVAAPGDDLRLGMLQQQADGFLHAPRFIQGFDIIHFAAPAFRRE